MVSSELLICLDPGHAQTGEHPNIKTFFPSIPFVDVEFSSEYKGVKFNFFDVINLAFEDEVNKLPDLLYLVQLQLRNELSFEQVETGRLLYEICLFMEKNVLLDVQRSILTLISLTGKKQQFWVSDAILLYKRITELQALANRYSSYHSHMTSSI